MKILSHGCTLDCFDICKFDVHVENEEVLKIEGDKNHPYTKGIICKKGRKHLERLKHKDRIYTPLKKVNGKWMEISFEEAIDLISEKLSYYKEKYTSKSILHYNEYGSGGILKGIEDVFFNFYGGITKSKGSTCWGAGIQAQKYDFGDVKGHTLEDMIHSKNIILWGRNPANTSIHLMQMIKKAKSKGIKIIVIDPIYTDTGKNADMYIPVNPSTDGALAMAMTKIIIEEKLLDQDFIRENVKGFEEYKNYLNTLDMEYLSKECNVSMETIKELAMLYGKEKYTTIYVGYGLQKYKNGGNAIRAIDAMGAITGSIGKQGGGINYANKVYSNLLDLDPYESSKYAQNDRYFNVHHFSDFIKKENNPKIKCIFVSKGNPLSLWPNLNEALKAFRKIEFKVCIDMFMTDTAKECDLFIPCTNTLESEDLLYSSMNNPYIIYNEKAVDPKNKLMDEYYFFMELANKMNMKTYPKVSKKEYLGKIILPLKGKGITLERIKNEYIHFQEREIAWEDLKFKTPSKKIEIFSQKAKEDGLSGIPVYEKSKALGSIRLLTTHPKNTLFSQHLLDIEEIATAYIPKKMGEKKEIKEEDIVTLKSENGEIKVKIKISEDIPENIILMYAGWWNKHGNPNFLTTNVASEMGGQVAYNETFVEIVKKC